MKLRLTGYWRTLLNFRFLKMVMFMWACAFIAEILYFNITRQKLTKSVEENVQAAGMVASVFLAYAWNNYRANKDAQSRKGGKVP